METTPTTPVTVHVTLCALMSDDTAEIFYVIIFSVLGGLVATFGVYTNMINFIVFLKQGFSDTVNVSLFSLALLDLLSLVMLVWVSLLWNPLFYNSGVPIISREVFHLTGGWPHGFAMRTTSWITAYTTLERCLCVLIPLRVKTVVTPTFTASMLVLILMINFATILPEYATAYIGWKFDVIHNRTMLGLLFTDRRDKINVLSFTIGGYLQIISFLCVLLFTTILVIKMKQKSRWRAKTANVGHDSRKGTSKRDTKTVNMVIFIAVIFSVCYLPTVVASLMTSLLTGFNIADYNHNVFLVVWSFAFLADAINSSVNIFVYYRMSSKYRATCDSLFGKSSLKQK